MCRAVTSFFLCIFASLSPALGWTDQTVYVRKKGGEKSSVRMETVPVKQRHLTSKGRFVFYPQRQIYDDQNQTKTNKNENVTKIITGHINKTASNTLVEPLLDQRCSGGEDTFVCPRQLLKRSPTRLFSQLNGAVFPPGQTQQPVPHLVRGSLRRLGGWKRQSRAG